MVFPFINLSALISISPVFVPSKKGLMAVKLLSASVIKLTRQIVLWRFSASSTIATSVFHFTLTFLNAFNWLDPFFLLEGHSLLIAVKFAGGVFAN